jgi:hypothetical protein
LDWAASPIRPSGLTSWTGADSQSSNCFWGDPVAARRVRRVVMANEATERPRPGTSNANRPQALAESSALGSSTSNYAESTGEVVGSRLYGVKIKVIDNPSSCGITLAQRDQAVFAAEVPAATGRLELSGALTVGEDDLRFRVRVRIFPSTNSTNARTFVPTHETRHPRPVPPRALALFRGSTSALPIESGRFAPHHARHQSTPHTVSSTVASTALPMLLSWVRRTREDRPAGRGLAARARDGRSWPDDGDSPARRQAA